MQNTFLLDWCFVTASSYGFNVAFQIPRRIEGLPLFTSETVLD